LLPLGIFAGKLCWISIVDPVYHGLVWLHERLIPIVAVFAVVSVGFAVFRFIRVQDSLRLLFSLRAEPPAELERVFRAEAKAQRVDVQLRYIDTPHRFCFTIFSGPSIVISRGFAEQLGVADLEMVANHEVRHVHRRDPWRSIAWHLFFSSLLLPGFEPLEDVLHMRRERAVDADVVRKNDRAQSYYDLLARCSTRVDQRFGAICTTGVGAISRVRGRQQVQSRHLWKRSLPALASVVTLALVFFSHSVFMTNLEYLRAHHC